MAASNRKSSRGTSGGRPRTYSELYRNSREGAVASEPARPGQPVVNNVVVDRITQVDWRAEYGHVIDDIRRLGIVTGVLILAMLAASFVL